MSRNWRKTSEPEKARRVAFFRNGHYFDAGVRVAFRGPRPFPTMAHLLDYLSARLRIPARRVFSAEGGAAVLRLDQFVDGRSYAVSADGKFEPMPYGAVPRLQTSHVADALPARPEDLSLLRAPPPKQKKRRKKTEMEGEVAAPARVGRLLTLSTRDSGNTATLLFNDRHPPPFEDVLRDFGRALGLRQVRQMETASGRPVRSLSQLKNEFQDVNSFYLDDTKEPTPSGKEGSKSAFNLGGNQRSARRPLTVSRPKTNWRKQLQKKNSKFRLDWVHGYSGGQMFTLETGELVYSVGAAVVLYHRATDSQRHYLGHTEDVCSLSIHPSGKMMASGQASSDNQDPAVHVWMVDTLQTIAILTRLLGTPMSIAFSAHDFVLLSVEKGLEEHSLTFWDWESDSLLARVELHGEVLTGGCFHPHEPDLAMTFGEHHLTFWRRRTDGLVGRADALAPGHSGRTIQSWTFVGDSVLAVGDSSGYVTLWSLLPGDNFRILREVKAHQAGVRCLLTMREGTVISGATNQLKAWDAQRNFVHLTTTHLPESEVQSLCQQGPGDVGLFVGTAHSILDGSLQSSFRALVQCAEVECLDVAADPHGDSFVSVDRARNVCRWTTRYLLWKTQSQAECCCVGFHPSGRVVTAGCSNGRLLVLNAEGGTVVAGIAVADVALVAIAYNKEGDTLAIGCDDGNVYICGSRNHGYLYKMHSVLKNEWPILQLDWSADGDCIQTTYRKDGFCEAGLWRVSESKRLKSALSKNMEWPEHTCTLSHTIIGIWSIESAFYLSCHRKNSHLASGTQDGWLRVFPYPYGETHKSFVEEQKQSSQPVNAVRFLKEKVLVSASSSAIFVWNLKL